MANALKSKVPSEIKKLYDSLTGGNHSGTVRLSVGELYPHAEKLLGNQKRFEEGLIIHPNYSNHESFMLASFNEGPLRALYQGDSAISMLKTLKFLELPNHWPNNLGENVFYIFMSTLEDADDGPVCIDQSIVYDDVMPFKPVLERLVNIYSAYSKK